MSVQISSTQMVEVRRNLVVNPDAGIGIAGFGGNASVGWVASRAADVDLGLPDGFAFYAEHTTGSSAPSAFSWTSPIAVTPGEAITASYYIFGSGWGEVQLGQRFIWSGGPGATVPNYVAIPTTEYSRVSQTIVVPDGATHVTVRPVFNSVPAGATLRVRRIQVERSPVVGPYFDGDSPDAVWVGTPDASESILLGNPVTMPDLVLGWEQSRAGGAVAQDVIGGGVRIAVGMSRPRTGTLELFYRDEAPAVAAFDMHQHAASFLLSDLDAPGSWREMRYVVTMDGGCRIRLDKLTRRRWIVEVDYQEMQVSL